MNTKQLIVSWNGSFILFIALFVISQSREFYRYDFLVPLITVLAIIAGIILAYLTYRDSKQIDKKKVFTRGIIPIPIISITGLGIIFIVSVIFSNSGSNFQSNQKNKIEIFEADYSIERSGGEMDKTIFSGRIKNNSTEHLTGLSIRVRIYKYNFDPPEFEPGESISEEEFAQLFPPWGSVSTHLKSISEDSLKFVGKQIDTEDLRKTNLSIPAKETKSFEIENDYPEIEPSNYWVWDYEVISAY